MASNVTPSSPGAPSFFLAISYASRNVFILQTWTYNPQKRQDGSAFALTYILRLRSCKLMGSFIISPLPPMLSEELQTVGSLCSAGITPLPCYCGPLRHPLAFDRFPGVSGYTVYLAPVLSPWDEEGFSSCSTRPCHRAVATTPPECPAASVRLRPSMLPSALRPRARHSRVPHFRGHLCIHFRYGPVTRSPSRRWLCQWASDSWFPASLPFKLQGF